MVGNDSERHVRANTAVKAVPDQVIKEAYIDGSL